MKANIIFFLIIYCSNYYSKDKFNIIPLGRNFKKNEIIININNYLTWLNRFLSNKNKNLIQYKYNNQINFKSNNKFTNIGHNISFNINNILFLLCIYEKKKYFNSLLSITIINNFKNKLGYLRQYLRKIYESHQYYYSMEMGLSLLKKELKNTDNDYSHRFSIEYKILQHKIRKLGRDREESKISILSLKEDQISLRNYYFYDQLKITGVSYEELFYKQLANYYYKKILLNLINIVSVNINCNKKKIFIDGQAISLGDFVWSVNISINPPLIAKFFINSFKNKSKYFYNKVRYGREKILQKQLLSSKINHIKLIKNNINNSNRILRIYNNITVLLQEHYKNGFVSKNQVSQLIKSLSGYRQGILMNKIDLFIKIKTIEMEYRSIVYGKPIKLEHFLKN